MKGFILSALAVTLGMVFVIILDLAVYEAMKFWKKHRTDRKDN